MSRQARSALLEEAMRELPESPELKATYASFIAEETPNAPVVDQMLNDAESLAERSAGPESAALMLVRHMRALVLQTRSQSAEALEVAREVLIRRQRDLGADHPDTLRTATLVALILFGQDRLAEAERLHRDVLGSRERALGPDHPDTIWSINNLANTVSELGRLSRPSLSIAVHSERLSGSSVRTTLRRGRP